MLSRIGEKGWRGTQAGEGGGGGEEKRAKGCGPMKILYVATTNQ